MSERVTGTLVVHTEVRRALMTDGTLGYMATNPQRPGAIGYGPTPESATESLRGSEAALDAFAATPDQEDQ